MVSRGPHAQSCPELAAGLGRRIYEVARLALIAFARATDDVPVNALHESGPRVAGQHARRTVRQLRMRCLLVLGLFGALTEALASTSAFRGLTFQVAELVLLAVCFVILRFALPIVDRRDRGATGEERVGAILEELAGEGWHVIHDAHIGHGNVDHILVGPPGVFTVETKSHPGPIRVRRLHGAILRQARGQRARVERIAGRHVEPLVVYSRAWVDHPGRPRNGVRIIPANMLRRHMTRRKPTLSPQEVQEILQRLEATLGR